MPSPTASQFVWYELHTPDAAAAAAFYHGVLGWGTRDAGMSGRPYSVISVDGTGIGGILGKPAESFTAGARPGWLGYLGVADVDAAAERVRQAGGTIHRAAEALPEVGRFAVAADPQGAIFVLFQPADAGSEPPRPAPDAPGAPAWHELYAVDGQAAFAFYADQFGWTKAEAMDMGAAGLYQTFAAGAAPIGGMMTRMDPTRPPAWLYYFNADEIGAAAARIQQHGGSIAYGPAEVPGGRFIVQASDPQGAFFGLVGPKA